MSRVNPIREQTQLLPDPEARPTEPSRTFLGGPATADDPVKQAIARAEAKLIRRAIKNAKRRQQLRTYRSGR